MRTWRTYADILVAFQETLRAPGASGSGRTVYASGAGAIGSEAVHLFGGSDAMLNWHVLAGRGYAVLYPDMPLEPGDPLHRLPGLVLPASDKLIDLGIADPARVGLMGHSFGAKVCWRSWRRRSASMLPWPHRDL